VSGKHIKKATDAEKPGHLSDSQKTLKKNTEKHGHFDDARKPLKGKSAEKAGHFGDAQKASRETVAEKPEHKPEKPERKPGHLSDVQKKPVEASGTKEHSAQAHIDSIILDLLGTDTSAHAQKDTKDTSGAGDASGTSSVSSTSSTSDNGKSDTSGTSSVSSTSSTSSVSSTSDDTDVIAAILAEAVAKAGAEKDAEKAESVVAAEKADIAEAPEKADIARDGAIITEIMPVGDSSVVVPDAVGLGVERPLLGPLRKRPVWPLIICALIIFIISTGGLTYLNRLTMAEQAEARAAIQREGSSYLDESIALIQEADSVVIALDKAIESQVREEDVPQLEALLEQVDDTQGSLDRAIEIAKSAQATFIEDESRGLARYAQEAAEHRKEMLELSSQLTSYDVAAMKSALSLEYAWSLIVDADANMRSAVEAVAGGGANAVEASRDYNQQALDKLDLADEMLAVTASTFPTANLRPINAYLEAKKKSVELALASDDAFLEGDYYTASVRNEEFIEQDAEVVRLAVEIPSDPLSVVVVAYEEAVGQLRDEYKTVRSQAADVDAHLRAYLGVDTLQGTDARADDDVDAEASTEASAKADES
jgi:hypothetical protein